VNALDSHAADPGRRGDRAEEPVVVLGVTGGIAAYKAVSVCRELVARGLHVVVVMTEAAEAFVGRQTFAALSSEPVQTALFGAEDPIPHTRLARRAEAVVVAPATAHLLARYAHGLADDLLGATLLATRAPVVVAPAMHTEMWEHPAVRENLATLRRRGVAVVEPETGRLAGGDVGAGRLADPERIVEAVLEALARGAGRTPDLAGRRVLVTAGGTREPLDAVRYLGNRSSGRQGHALAEAAAARGAIVTLLTSADQPVPAEVTLRRFETAEDLRAQLAELSPSQDVVVMAAAVADFRPVLEAGAGQEKWHRSAGPRTVLLEPTPDLLAELAARRRPGQVLVGFAAELGDVRERAQAKLHAKGVDLVVGNDLTRPGAGFATPTNAVVVVDREGVVAETDLVSKRAAADVVLDAVVRRLAR